MITAGIKHSLVIILLFLFSPGSAQPVKGMVKSYRDSYYSLNETYGVIKRGSKIIDSSFPDQFVTFDNEGNVAQLTEYLPDGTILASFDAISCDEGNHYESLYIRYGRELIIDKKDFMIESVKYPSGEFCFINYIKDLHGRPTEETMFNHAGRVLCSVKISRDEKGNPTEYRFSDSTVYQYRYDSKGNKIEWILITSAGNKILTYYKYDQMGNVTEEEIDNFYKSSYKFHVEHNTFKYQYDRSGNWIERIDYEHDIPQRMVVRIIEYPALSGTLR